MMDKKKQTSNEEKAKWLNPVLNALRDLGGSGKTREVIKKVASMERVSERSISSSQNSFTLMEYYDKVPLAFYAICYRVEISNIGVARYVIDSFTEASSLYLQ